MSRFSFPSDNRKKPSLASSSTGIRGKTDANRGALTFGRKPGEKRAVIRPSDRGAPPERDRHDFGGNGPDKFAVHSYLNLAFFYIRFWIWFVSLRSARLSANGLLGRSHRWHAKPRHCGPGAEQRCGEIPWVRNSRRFVSIFTFADYLRTCIEIELPSPYPASGRGD